MNYGHNDPYEGEDWIEPEATLRVRATPEELERGATLEAEICEDCGAIGSEYDLHYRTGGLLCDECFEEREENRRLDEEERFEHECLENTDLIDGVGFAGPGTALRAATRTNPRNLPCPTCKAPNRLTPLDRARHYQCDACADRAERGWDE